MNKLAIAIIGAVALASTPAFAGKSKQWNRGCEDAKRGYYDQDNHPQAYKDGNRACETAAAPADDGTPKDLKDLVNGSRVGGEVDDELNIGVTKTFTPMFLVTMSMLTGRNLR